jgi:hypothetical protein
MSFCNWNVNRCLIFTIQPYFLLILGLSYFKMAHNISKIVAEQEFEYVLRVKIQTL